MRLSQFLEQKLNEYAYQKRRKSSKYKKDSKVNGILNIINDLDEIDNYIGDKIDEMDRFLLKYKK